MKKTAIVALFALLPLGSLQAGQFEAHVGQYDAQDNAMDVLAEHEWECTTDIECLKECQKVIDDNNLPQDAAEFCID